MKNPAFSLATSLLTVMNENDPKDPAYVLAKYFLQNFDHLKDLNGSDVAQACYVSRSGLRRFCQSIGYENFSQLKQYGSEWELLCGNFITSRMRPNYRDYLSRSLAEMLEEINRLASPAVLDRLTGSIHDSRQVVLFTSDYSSMAACGFQQGMVVAGRLVQILSTSPGMEERLQGLTRSDLLLVLSSTGTFAGRMQPVVSRTAAKRVLITVSHEKQLWHDYEQVVYLSEKSTAPSRAIYSQYGLTYFFDLLYSHYLQRYRAEAGTAPVSEQLL